MNWVIHVGVGLWQKEAVLYSQSLGLNVIGLDGSDNAACKNDCQLFVLVDITNAKEVLECVQQLLISNDIQNLVGIHCIANDAGQISAAVLREHYNLPGVGVKAAKFFTNKLIQRDFWSLHDTTLYPKYLSIKSDVEVINNQYKDFIDSLSNDKIIIKPVDSAGSRGITVCDKNDHDTVIEAISFAKKTSNSGEVVIEEYIVGNEITVDAITVNGVSTITSITDKFKAEGTQNTVSNLLVSKEMSNEKLSFFEKCFDTISKELGENDFVSHSEFIIDKDKNIWHVESACRGPGFGVFDQFIPNVYGINPMNEILNIEINNRNTHRLFRREFKHIFIGFLPSKSGTIQSIDCSKVPQDIELNIFKSVGDKMSNASSDGDRILSVRTEVPDNIQADEYFNKILDLIEVKYISD